MSETQNQDKAETYTALWKTVIESHFPGLLYPSIVGASVVAQLLIKDICNPFALIYVDVPSSGKTIVLNFFSDLPVSYLTDNFSPKSFVTHATNIPKEKLEAIDMLPQIRHKVLIIRELATIFGKRPDDLLESVGILTRILDGQGYTSNSGVHGSRGYKGDYTFMMMAASTPLQPKVWNILGNFGSRLFFCTLNSPRKSEMELSKQLNDNWQEKENLCKIATNVLFNKIQKKHPQKINWNKTKDDSQARLFISRSAILLAKLRGTINVWTDDDDGDQNTAPIIEHSDRINQLLYNLARGHAVIHDRDYITTEDIPVVLSVTLDSTRLSRSKLFRFLISKDGFITTSEVQEHLGVSDKSAMKEMRTFALLGLAELQTGLGTQASTLHLDKSLEWFRSEEYRSLDSKS